MVHIPTMKLFSPGSTQVWPGRLDVMRSHDKPNYQIEPG